MPAKFELGKVNELDVIEESFNRITAIAKYLRYGFMFLFWGTVISVGIVASFMLVRGVSDYGSGNLVPAVSSIFKILIEMLIALIVIWVLESMFDDISQGMSPFTRVQAKRLRLTAVFLLVHAALVALTSPAILSVFGLGDVAVGATIGSASAEGAARFIPINAGDIVLAVVLFCAALIVEYGSLLQKLSDDTL